MLVWLRRCLLCVSALSCHVATAALPPGFSYEAIGSGWNEAVGVTFTEDGQLFVEERSGRVWRVAGTTKAPTPFLDIAPEVNARGDFGMLGLALHPNFANNGYVYVSYVVDRHHLANCNEPASGTGAPICGPLYSATTNQYFAATIGRVTRYTAIKPTGDPDFLNATTVDYNSRKVLVGETSLTGCPITSDSHGTGSLAFGDDGTLLVACGEGASAFGIDFGSRAESYWNQALTGTPQIITLNENVGAFRSQMVWSLAGKILRLDPLTGDGVPSNPMYDAADPRSPSSRLWVLGLRNPFRFTHVRGTGSHDPAFGNPGTLLIGDVGWLTREDFHVSRTGGENFGWPIYEGIDEHTGYVATITYNLDAPNPLFGIGGCAQRFFAFQDLLKSESLNPVAFKNPCDPAVDIPASVPHWQHRRPEIDWDHAPTSARWSTFDALGNPVAYQIGENGVTGAPFVGNSSTAGVFYTGDDFPPAYKNTYFHADYGAGWVRQFVLNGNFKPLAVEVFDDTAGPVVDIATNPVTGGLYFVVWNGGVNRVVYGTGNLPPVAAITVDRSYGSAPLTVQFNSDTSSDPEGLPLTYLWNFGDGSATSTEANPSHTFTAPTSAPRSYTVSLQVTDSEGLTHTTTFLVSANNTPPVVDITTPPDGTEYSLASPTVYHVSANVTDDEHSAAQVACSIRLTLHHNSHRHDDPPIPACEADVQVAPLGCDSESYYWRIGFTATDAAGLAGYDEVLLLPDCPSPTLTANAGPDRTVVDNNGNGSEILLLDGSASSDTNGTITNYIWYRDGVQVATGVTANVSFAEGVHQMRLEVLNDGGSQAADTAQITVLPQGTNLPPTAAFTMTPTAGPVPLTVAVDATPSTDPDGTIVQYTWNWGDGTTTNGTSKTAAHQYAIAGNYTLRLTARDNGNTTATTTRTVNAEAAWWNTSWGVRRKLTFNNVGIGTSLTNVPVLVKLDPSRIDYALARSDGADLRFIDANNTTQLNYEIATWNPGGVSTVWVKVPQIDANSVTDSITMYYGNPAAPPVSNPALVWNNGYVAVWHLDTNFNDSTANANNATNQGTTIEAGPLGNARRFDGTASYIDAGDTPTLALAGTLTIEAMAKRDADADPNAQARIVDKKLTAATPAGYSLFYQHAAQTMTMLGQTSARANALVDVGDQWVYLTATITGTRAQLYMDGVNLTSDRTISALTANTEPLRIGGMSGGGAHWDGLLDEIRISNVARSNDWIAAQQRSLTDTLITQPVSTNTPPTIAITSPTNGAFLTAPATFTITAAADDSDGTVSQVAFFVDGSLLGTDASAPFSIGWVNPAVGGHTLTAVATDNAGASKGSAPVNVTVTTSPTISITAPTAGSNVSGPDVTIDYTISGTAYDHLHLLLDSQPEVMVTNPTGSYTFVDVPNGPHDVAVFLVDAQHNALPNAGATANVTFNVAPEGDHAPSVSAGPDQTGAVGDAVHFEGVVTDDGLPNPPGATTVQWTKVSGPGTPTWPLGDSDQAHTHVVFPLPGIYVLRLTASDSALTGFDEVTVTVTGVPNVAPTALFTFDPPRGAVPLIVTVDATDSTDSDGTIVNYVWNFGDGATSSGASPTTSHQYTVAANYTITLTAVDEDGGTDTTTHVVTVESDWWNTAWRGRRLLTFNNAGIPASLNDVPVLVKLDPSRIDYAQTQPNGRDLRFIDADNATELDYEIATWNPTGVSTVWVKVPQIDANSTTDAMTLYYDNPDAPAAQNPSGVWSNGYAAVWHFDANLLDSTGNGNTGVNRGTFTTSEAGYLGNARRFDGVNSYIDAGNNAILAIAGALTIEAMARRDADADPDIAVRVVDKKPSATAVDGYNLQYLHATIAMTNRSSGTSFGKANVDLGTDWAYIGSSIDSATAHAKLYVDGHNEANKSDVLPLVAGTTPLSIGRAFGGGSVWDGLLDEIRISYVVRNNDWMDAQQRSLSDTLITYQTGPNNTPPTVAITAPADGAVLEVPASLTIDATANDDDSITQVGFFADGILIATDALAPYSISWNNPTPGNHRLTATATDSGNLSAVSPEVFVTFTVPLGNQPPSVSAGPDLAGIVGQSVLIQGIANDDGLPAPPDLVLEWTSQSGPGIPMWPSGEGDQALTHVVFPVAGTYVLRLTADDGELESFDQVTVTIADTPNVVPTATFTADPPNGGVPLTVTVDATGSFDTDGTIVDYAWDFGDGATSSGPATSTSHQYTAVGNYTIALTVTDNGGATAAATRAVSTADWWDTAWGARLALTLNNGGVNADLTNIPVLVKLDPSRINYAAVAPNGADLRFIDADNATVLDYEIGTWNPGGVSTIWVKVPQIDANSTTDSITLYYNNPLAPPAQNPAAVWSNGYAAVWHFDANLSDSTANANHGVNGGTISEAGYLGNARRFDGVANGIDGGTGASLAITPGLTIEALVKRDADANPNTAARIVDKKAGANSVDGYNLQYVHATKALTNRSTGSEFGRALVDLDARWAYVASTIDDAYAQVYVDGENLTNKPGVQRLVAGDQPLTIGRESGGASGWDGLLDEIRISNVARSAEWIIAQQRSLSDGLITYQAGSANALPSVAITAPAAAATVPLQPLQIDATATDDGSVTQVSFYADGALIGTDTIAPYSISWDNPAVGNRTLTAIATDDGNLNAISTPIAITVAAPVGNQAPSVDAGPDKAGIVGQTIQIQATTSDDGLPNPPAAMTAQWTQQNGPGTAYWPLNDSHLLQTHIVFPVAGAYTMRLTTNDSALAAFDEVTVTVTDTTNVPPVASFTLDPTTGATPLTIAMDATLSSDSDGAIAGYAWDFGDGATGSGATASHQYTAHGDFTVTLTVTDDGGATNSTTHSVTVESSLWIQIKAMKAAK